MSIRRSLIISFSHRYLGLVIRFAMLIVTARLITPEHFGAVAIATSIYTVVTAITGLGLTPYLIQEDELSEERIRTALTLTTVLSLLGALVLVASSGHIAALVGNEVLEPVLDIMAIALPLGPFTQATQSLLQREMKFGVLMIIGLCATTVATATAIGLAWLGFGGEALAWSNVSFVAAAAVGVLFFPAAIPPVRPCLREWRAFLSFSGPTIVLGVVGPLGTMVPNIIIGRMLGFDAAGFFNRAHFIIDMINSVMLDALKPVALSCLVADRRAGRPLKDAYLAIVTYVSAFAWPLCVFILCMADQIIAVLLGPQWTSVDFILQILALMLLSVPLCNLNYEVFLSGQRLNRFLRQDIVYQLARAAFVAAGALHGLEAACVALVAARIPHMIYAHAQMKDMFGLTCADVAKASSKSAAVTLVSGAPVVVLALLGHASKNDVIDLAVAGTAFGAAWLAGILLVKHPLRKEILMALDIGRDRLRAYRASRGDAPAAEAITTK